MRLRQHVGEEAVNRSLGNKTQASIEAAKGDKDDAAFKY
jgi:hypothetical protein